MSEPKEINMNPTPSYDGVKYFLNIPAFVAHDSRLRILKNYCSERSFQCLTQQENSS